MRLVTEPLAFTKWMSMVNEQCNICVYVDVVGFKISFIVVEVSLWTVTAISVDRHLAQLLGLRYKQVVTLKRTYMIVIAFWILQTALSVALFWKTQPYIMPSKVYLCVWYN